ncbi:MAG: hypothetical protein AB1505_17105 [Candidatus Latescibacterota bacterium]
MHIDWDQAAARTALRLQRMIRFATTNPPGNEKRLAEGLAAEVREAGLPAEVVEPAPGRGSLAVRLPGRGAARPLLLLSHLDVVPAEPSAW